MVLTPNTIIKYELSSLQNELDVLHFTKLCEYLVYTFLLTD